MRFLRRLEEPLGRVLARLGRGARRLRGLAVVALLSAVAATGATVWRLDRRPPADLTVGAAVQVGVPQGQSIPGYVESSRAELAALLAGPPPGEVYALVALTAYLAPDRLTPVLGGVATVEVATRVPIPAVQTQIVRFPAFRIPEDVTGGMEEAAARKDREAAHYADLLAKVGADKPELRAVYASGQRVAEVEAVGYRGHCSCVYAAVVRAAPAALDVLAHREQVRVVDPAPEVRRLDRAVFLPPLPEQTEVARPPDDSGAAPAVSSR